MAFAQKTLPTDMDVGEFIRSMADQGRRSDAIRLAEILGRASGEAPRMWGDAIVGFGEYRYRYPTGHAGRYFLTGFAPRKAAMTIHVMSGFDAFAAELARLGKFKNAKSCLYINRLADIDESTLERVISQSVATMRALYPG